MKFRRYESGDEEGIVSVMNKSFSTFREWGLTPEKWLGYEVDPGFKRENAFVAEEDGKIVGHVQVVERELHFGKFVRTAGIANVCTDPEYRKMGMATDLMRFVMEQVSKEYCLAGLDTGYGSSAHRIYRRVGFSPFHFFARLSAEAWDARRSLDKLKRFSEGMDEVQPFERNQEEAMKKIYAENAEITMGVHRRSDGYWEEKLFKRNSWQTFFYRELRPDDVLVFPDRGYAYLDWDEQRKALHIRECLAHPNDFGALASLYGKAIEQHQDAHEITISIPEGDPAASYLLGDFYQFREPGSYMMSITNLRDFLNQVGPLAGAGSGVAELRVYNDVTQLEPVNVNLRDFTPTEKAADVRVGLHQRTLLRMIAGLESPERAAEAGLIEVSGISSYLMTSLRSLFYLRRFHLWPPDHW
ncbi:MAG: GNAT family N-acetyltransferase [Thermoprotei archaeon]|nr:GNAT family N-acetyltransferase [TACK group archaeon]